MKHNLKTRLLSLLLCISMIVPVVAKKTSVEAEGEKSTTTNYGAALGAVAEIGAESVNLYGTPAGEETESIFSGVSPDALPEKVVITDYYYNEDASEETNRLWYEIDAAPGYTWPEAYESAHWLYAYSVDIVAENGTTGVFDAEGNAVTELTLPLYDKISLTAESSLQGSVKYQWQICYDTEKDLWVDIYGADEAELTVSIGMIATLLVDGTVNVRCVSASGSKKAVSEVVEITVDFDNVGGDEGEDPVEPTLEIQMNGVSAESITTTYGNYDFAAMLTASTTLSGSLTYKWEVLTDETNNQWSTLSTEASCSFTYGDMQFKYYDAASDISTIKLTVSNGEASLTDTFVVYRVAEVYVTNSTGDTTGAVDVTVSGTLPEDASLNLGDASDTTIGGVDSSEIALALDVTITQYGEEWQPAEGETVRVSIPASQLGLSDGEYFAVYHIHDGKTELLGPFKVENGYVSFEIDGFSVVVISTNYGAAIGGVAEFAGSSVVLDNGAVNFAGTSVWIEDENLPTKVVIKNYYFDDYLGKLFYEIDAAPGYTWPEEYAELHWCYSDALTNINVNGEAGVYDENGDSVTEVTVSTTESITVKVETSLQSADIDYKWQICYDTENDLWVDITGETSSEISITAGMIVSLMDENNQAKVRCVTIVGSKSVVSDPITVTLYVEDSGATEEPKVEIQIDGTSADSVDVNDADKNKFVSRLSANTNLTGELTYNWEVLYNVNLGMWKVLGEEATFHPVFDMDNNGMYIGSYYIHYVDAATSAVTIRLTVSNGVSTLQDTFIINIKYPEEEVVAANYSRMARSVASSSVSNEGISTVADTSIYNVVIEYLFDKDKSTAADPYTSTVGVDTILNNTVVFPMVQGYLPYLIIDGEYVQTNSYTFPGEKLTEDFYLTVYYKPTEVNYTINVYLQNAEDDNYELTLTDTDKALTGTVLEEIVFNIDGYYQSKMTSNKAEIASDGSTIFNLYYDRIYYLMKFDLDGGYGVQPVYARHGTSIEEPIPVKPGYTFMGWDADNDDTTLEDLPTKMPIGGGTYKAVWKAADKANVTVVFWGENPNDKKYSYISSHTISLTPGTSFNYEENTLTCGEQAHKHIVEDCYELKCTQTEHIHGDDCYNCAQTEATHTINCYKISGNGTIDTSPTDEWYFTQDAVLNANGLYVYDGIMQDRYYIKVGDNFYRVNNADGNSKAVIRDDCGCHIHSDACCSLNLTAHEHTIAECYNLTCTQDPHNHTVACYPNTHTLDTNLWELVTSDTIIVAADGSSVVNVYYDRVEYTLTFSYSYSGGSFQKVKTITAKWGAKIDTEYKAIADDCGSTFWSHEEDGDGPYTNYFGVMPKPFDEEGNVTDYTYFHRSANGNTGTMYYYGQDLNGEYTIELFSVPNVGGYYVSDEDRYEFEGFTYASGTANQQSCSNAKFYYNRNKYSLDFSNGESIVKNEIVPYEGPLDKYDFTPTVPSYYQAGSVEFAGWYKNPECTGEEVKLDETTMPASNMILYAKWVPVKHDVTIYRYKNEDGTFPTGIDILYSTFQVSHGSTVQTTLGAIPEEPDKEPYTFVGWFYMDGDEEKAFDFGSMSVTQDLEIYAKWSSNVLVPYTIKYVIKDTTTEIAEATTGKQYAGETKTFNAKTAGELMEDYQTGYYPIVRSHSIEFEAEVGSYVYTFEYVAKESVPYTVYYLAETLKEGDIGLGTMTIDEKTYYKVVDDKTVNSTSAIVTENFAYIQGYMPDAYQKTLILEGANDAVNQIIFYYDVDTTHAYYKVSHYTQNLDGSWYEYSTYQSMGTIGDTYTEGAKTITGFTYDPTVDGSLPSGELTDQGLHLKLYYTRNKYPYKVEYREHGTGTLWNTDYFTSADQLKLYGETISVTPGRTFTGYHLVSDSPVGHIIQIEQDENLRDPKANVIIFYYAEDEVTINYEVVGPADCGTVNPTTETVKVHSGKPSSTATVSGNVYKFVGWFDNENCDGYPISTDVTYNPAKVDGLHVAATYYARFEYNLTSLSIKKVTTDKNGNVVDYSAIDPNQTFVFRIVGTDVDLIVTIHGDDEITITGLTVGNTYTVTEENNWSWRYDFASWAFVTDGDTDATGTTNGASITLGATGNEITFTNERNKEQWLDGDSYKVNIFSGNN